MTLTLEEVRDEFVAADLPTADLNGDGPGFTALCPVCHPSLSELKVIEREGEIEIVCPRGCERDRIGDALYARRQRREPARRQVRSVMLAEFTALLGLEEIGRSVETVRVFGRGSKATVVIELDDESTIFLEPIGAVATAPKLSTEVALQTGATPTLKAAGVQRALKLIHDLGVLQPTIEIEDRARDLGAQYLAGAVIHGASMGDQSERWQAFSLIADADNHHSSRVPRFVIEDPDTGLRYVRIDWLRSFVRTEAGPDTEKVVRAMPLVGWTKPGTEGRIKATETVGRRTLQWAFFVVPKSWA